MQLKETLEVSVKVRHLYEALRLALSQTLRAPTSSAHTQFEQLHINVENSKHTQLQRQHNGEITRFLRLCRLSETTRGAHGEVVASSSATRLDRFSREELLL